MKKKEEKTVSNRPLTSRQRQVMRYIENQVDVKQIPPTMRQIAEHIGVASVNAVDQHLEALRKKGYIEKGSGAREITIKRRL